MNIKDIEVPVGIKFPGDLPEKLRDIAATATRLADQIAALDSGAVVTIQVSSEHSS